jgi:hypothetical protein
VLDADDAEADARIVELFGESPGQIKTRRGRHRLYRQGGADLGTISSLKPFGLNADIKHGRSIVVAPPSRHEDDRSFAYVFENCDASVLRDLPPLDSKAFRDLIGGESAKRALGFRDDSRGQNLNDKLVAFVSLGFDDDQDAWNLILAEAHVINDGYERGGLERLPEAEVVSRARKGLEDHEAGKFTPRHNRRATATTNADEVRFFASVPQGVSALTLLMLLRAEHGARCKRGETFAICPRAMRRDQVLADWSEKRLREARTVLLELDFIREVTSATRSSPAQYELVDRV